MQTESPEQHLSLTLFASAQHDPLVLQQCCKPEDNCAEQKQRRMLDLVILPEISQDFSVHPVRPVRMMLIQIAQCFTNTAVCQCYCTLRLSPFALSLPATKKLTQDISSNRNSNMTDFLFLIGKAKFHW
jgi:hypothetical protein